MCSLTFAQNPSHMIPGIEPSADPVLQSRLFSYPDAHRHRVGVNYQQLPVNAPITRYQMANFQRDGSSAFYNQGSVRRCHRDRHADISAPELLVEHRPDQVQPAQHPALQAVEPLRLGGHALPLGHPP